MEMSLDIKHINKNFGELEIFRDFSISFHTNSINCILGPSGCGKTTLLNIINGTVHANSGIQNDFLDLRLSYVFQEPRLLPWKNVEENIAFVLKERMQGVELKQRLDQYISMMQLEKFCNYYPSKLSGGMKQRVALARAFSYQSDVILMDEPFKALDYKLKINLIEQFIKLWESDKRTVIFVTHDVDEALMIGQHLFLLSNPPVQITNEYKISEGQGEKDKMRILLLNKLNSPV
jgi:NitT/TauT family transport system ATP-binding protein